MPITEVLPSYDCTLTSARRDEQRAAWHLQAAARATSPRDGGCTPASTSSPVLAAHRKRHMPNSSEATSCNKDRWWDDAEGEFHRAAGAGEDSCTVLIIVPLI